MKDVLVFLLIMVAYALLTRLLDLIERYLMNEKVGRHTESESYTRQEKKDMPEQS